MSKAQGELAELKFQVLATEKGFIVSKPTGDNQSYDFIIEKKGRLLKIQVKSTFGLSTNKTPRYSFNIGKGASTKNLYKKKFVDYFAFYIFDIDTWYLVPFDILEGKLRLNIYISNPKLDRYKENWNI